MSELKDATPPRDSFLELKKEVADLKAQLAHVANTLAPRFAWEEKISESGIQLAGGPTTITQKGHMRGVTAIQTNQGMAFVFVMQNEVTQKFAILSPELLKPVTD